MVVLLRVRLLVLLVHGVLVSLHLQFPHLLIEGAPVPLGHSVLSAVHVLSLEEVNETTEGRLANCRIQDQRPIQRTLIVSRGLGWFLPLEGILLVESEIRGVS